MFEKGMVIAMRIILIRHGDPDYGNDSGRGAGGGLYVRFSESGNDAGSAF